jgi:hypothetical protein
LSWPEPDESEPAKDKEWDLMRDYQILTEYNTIRKTGNPQLGKKEVKRNNCCVTGYQAEIED